MCWLVWRIVVYVEWWIGVCNVWCEFVVCELWNEFGNCCVDLVFGWGGIIWCGCVCCDWYCVGLWDFGVDLVFVLWWWIGIVVWWWRFWSCVFWVWVCFWYLVVLFWSCCVFCVYLIGRLVVLYRWDDLGSLRWDFLGVVKWWGCVI